MPTEFRSLATLLNGERARHGAADVTLAATPAPLDAISRAPFPHVGQHNSKVCVICAAIHDLATPAPLSPIVITVCPHSVDTRFTHCLLCERATPAAYAEETP